MEKLQSMPESSYSSLVQVLFGLSSPSPVPQDLGADADYGTSTGSTRRSTTPEGRHPLRPGLQGDCADPRTARGRYLGSQPHVDHLSNGVEE